MTKELHQINYSANSSESIARCIYIGALAGHELGACSSPKMMQS